jgi:hypothetical protein
LQALISVAKKIRERNIILILKVIVLENSGTFLKMMHNERNMKGTKQDKK